MGKQVGAYASNFTGKVGQVVGRKGENGYVVAAYQPVVYNPRTEAQEFNRMKFAFMSSTASLFANAGALCYNAVRSSRAARQFIKANYSAVDEYGSLGNHSLLFTDTKLSDGVSGKIRCTLRYAEPGATFGGQIGFSDLQSDDGTAQIEMIGGKQIFVMDVSEDGFVMGKYGFQVFTQDVSQSLAQNGILPNWNVPYLPIGASTNVAVFFIPKLAVDGDSKSLVAGTTGLNFASERKFVSNNKKVSTEVPYKWGATSYLGMIAVTAGGSQG